MIEDEIRMCIDGTIRCVPVDHTAAEVLACNWCVQECMRVLCGLHPEMHLSPGDARAWDAAVDRIREKHASEFYRNGQPRLIIGTKTPAEPYELEPLQEVARTIEQLI